MEYVKAFLCGGALCAIGQILIDRTALTPAKILVCYVTAGVALSGAGLYQPLVDWAGAGATVPLTGQRGPAGGGGERRPGRPHRRRHRGRRGHHCGHLLRLSGGPGVQAQAQEVAGR